MVANNLERVSKDIQTEEIKLSELYKQQMEMMGFLESNGILKQKYLTESKNLESKR